MPNLSHYQALIKPLITRNRGHIATITTPSFWLNDTAQENGSHTIEIGYTSQKGWLKFVQENGKTAIIYPIDGEGGVFKDPPPVDSPTDFQTESGKTAGGCDVLVLTERWRFVELKIEATSREPLQIAENRDKAAMQLARTLSSFKERLPDGSIHKQNAECIIITPPFYPRIAQIPMAMSLRFLQKFGVKLGESSTDDSVKL